MTVFILILSFFLFAVLQSMMINGVHLSMDGKDKIDKEGNWYGMGDILYPISRELRTATKRKEVLSFGASAKAISRCSSQSSKPYPPIEIVINGNFEMIAYKKDTPEGSLVVAALQDMMINYGVRYCDAKEIINVSEPPGIGYFLLWVDSFNYKYPAYIRKAIGGGCIKCMASFYGTITFIPAFLLIYGYHWLMFPLWVVNIFVLVFMNFLLYKQ